LATANATKDGNELDKLKKGRDYTERKRARILGRKLDYKDGGKLKLTL